MKIIKSILTQTLIALALSFTLVSIVQAVNINTADAQSLSDGLNGVGIKKAQAIISWRDANGQFKTANDLTQVKGIGAKTVEKNKDDIQL